MTDIERPRRPVSDEVPGIRVARLRKLAVPRGDDGRLHVVLAAPAGKQEVWLVRRRRGFGYVYEAQCPCGHRALILRLDQASGWWRCAKCLGLRCARSRSHGHRTFTDLVLPLLLLERRRRKLSRRVGDPGIRDGLAEIEKTTAEQIDCALQRMMEVGP